MSKYYHPSTDAFRKLDLDPPEATPHGTPEDITENMKQLMPNSWHLEGNKLIGKTEMGNLVQTIPTDYILTGTDSNNLPIFSKVII